MRWGGVRCQGMGREMSWDGLERDVMRCGDVNGPGWLGVSCHGISGTRCPSMGYDEIPWAWLGQDVI